MRVGILGTSSTSAPIYKAVRSLHHRIVAIGSHPADPSVSLADEFVEVDYSRLNISEDLAGRVDVLVPTCNDTAYWASVETSRILGLPCVDSLDMSALFLNKSEFRHWGHAQGIPMPQFLLVDSETQVVGRGWTEDAFRGHWLVKPVDSHTGRGISMTRNAPPTPEAIARALAHSNEATVIVEQVQVGSLFSISAFLNGGTIVRFFVVDEYCRAYPYAVDLSNHPSTLTDGIQNQAIRIVSDLVLKLKLTQGLLHVQLIATETGPVVIECMRRCPGDFFGNLIQLSTGFPYYLHYVKGFLDIEQGPYDVATRFDSFVIRETLSVEAAGAFESMSFEVSGGPIRVFPLLVSGRSTEPLPGGKVAVSFRAFDSRELMHREVQRASRRSPNQLQREGVVACYE